MTEIIRTSMKMRGGNVHKKMLLDMLYPRHCPLCDTILSFGEGMVCDTCRKQQKIMTPPYCMKCGKTIEDNEEEYCKDCHAIMKSYNRGFPVFAYTGAIKHALYEFKYHNQRSYGDYFAECIVKQYGAQLKSLQLDGLVPVPIHRDKRRARGYNQAHVLADALGKRIHVPVYPSYIQRIVKTSPQKELNDKTRMKNLKNAFKIGQNAIELKKVLLVDDIYTSGATIEACTKVLLEAGVENVYYTSVAIGKGYTE